jgi:segregation and condensation protein A
MQAQQAPALSVARVAEPPVRIGVYDGPLELLLFLVRREGVDVRDIPVARICDAYLAFLDGADDLDVDKAGDYLLMAATLCHLKARELLPREQGRRDEEEEEIDPREALARRLLEYERYREAAEHLGARERLDRDVFARPAEPPAPDEQPIDPVVDAFGLARLFYGVMARAAAPPVVHQVVRERYSLLDTARAILRRLDQADEVLLSELFVECGTRARRVYQFLAVLEMARHQFVDVLQTAHLGAIRVIGRVRSSEADLTRIAAEDASSGADVEPPGGGGPP